MGRKTFHFHGPAGAGKDTQADFVISQFQDYRKVGAGDMFRSFANSDDEYKKSLYEKTVQGIWPTDEEVYKNLQQWITPQDNRSNLIFLSLVRRVSQIKYFENLLDSLGRDLDAFVLFEVPEDVVIKRLLHRYQCSGCKRIVSIEPSDEMDDVMKCELCGGELSRRSDDTMEAIRKRHSQYVREIAAIKEYYRTKGKLVLINGDQSREGVFEEMTRKLNF